MTDITELAQLKPGKYAILYRDNWDGEKNEYHTLAVLTEEGSWYDDEFNAELLKYQGDKILKVWPLDDGSNVLALVEALEKAQTENTAGVAGIAESYETTISMMRSRIAELEASHTKLRESMAAIHNTIRLDGAGTSLATILNAAKRAYEESASAAGIKLDVQPAQPCEHSMFWDASGVKRC
ncbi:hypothetical protein KOJKO3_c3961 [Klebsiella oxytoca]|nr:hypothetical protein KOJKO3_c3961 [Klebsiella oxytoca]